MSLPNIQHLKKRPILLYETLPTKKELELFREDLASERQIPAGIVQHLKMRKKTAFPMDVFQSVIPMLADFDTRSHNDTKEVIIKRSISLISKMGTLVAYWDRIRKDLDIKEPYENRGHAANFLYMLHGEIPDEKIAKDFDICLILHAEHSFNASTFSARVVASTNAHIYSCIGAAMAALSGYLAMS